MKELINRGIFGIIFLLFVFTPYYLDLTNSTNLFNLVLFVFSVFCTYELFLMSKNTAHPSLYFIPACITNIIFFFPMLLETFRGLFPSLPESNLWLAIQQTPIIFIIWVVVCVSSLGFISMIYIKKSIIPIFKYTFLLSIFYCILPLALLSMAMTLSQTLVKYNLLIVLLPIYLNDTLAYLFGRLFGKTKLFPSVSPKKTWEGFFGGLIGAVVVMNCILFILGNKDFELHIVVTIVSVLVSILATFGDLFESKLKRAAEVKDSGKILPGHGGVLDRIDAMLFTAPVLYVLLAYIL